MSVQLTPKTFDRSVQDHSVPLLVMFFADWCPHCQRAKPVWSQLPQMFGSRVRVAMFDVDQTSADRVLAKEGVRSFPTIKIYVNGKSHAYSGDRSKASLVDFVCKHGRHCAGSY
jgi:thiol-disulfide isomerase/thioredoxin